MWSARSCGNFNVLPARSGRERTLWHQGRRVGHEKKLVEIEGVTRVQELAASRGANSALLDEVTAVGKYLAARREDGSGYLFLDPKGGAMTETQFRHIYHEIATGEGKGGGVHVAAEKSAGGVTTRPQLSCAHCVGAIEAQASAF